MSPRIIGIVLLDHLFDLDGFMVIITLPHDREGAHFLE